MPFIDSYPDPFIPPSSTSRMNVIFDILPEDLVDYDIWLPRVRVNDVDVVIEGGLTIDNTDLSKTATFRPLDLADKSLFTSSASIDVGIGKKVSDVWDEASMQWEIVDGLVEGLEESVAGIPTEATDTVTITVAAKSDDRLGKTSEGGLIIYDSNRVVVSSDEFEPIKDANGTVYTPEVVGVPRLKLSHLFQEIFIERCGFDSYETNLPISDWPIQRYNIGMGQRFYDGLKGLMGMYRPIFRVTGNTIGIYDSTLALPAGVPAARAIEVDSVEALSTSREQQRVDALMIQFVGVENNYDFTAPRFEYPAETSGDSTIEYERIVIEFHKITSPGHTVIVREALNIENKTTTVNGDVVEESSEQFLFSSRGDVAVRTKTTQSLLPTLPDATPALRTSKEETEQFSYQTHPFKPRSVYCSRRALVNRGLVTNDSDNPNVFGNPALQEATVALRSNNIAEGQVYSTQELGSRIETAIPQRDGTVLTRVLVTDRVNPSGAVDYFEKRPGDIGVSGVASTQKVIPVFADDVTVRSAERLDDFPIGELPLRYGLPLARRELIFRRTKGRRVSLTHIGYDPSLQNGTPISAFERGGAAIGNFLVEGRQVVLDPRGLAIVLTGREIAGTSEPLQRLDSQIASLNSGETVVWTLPVECADGFFLGLDPVSVSNLMIEARHVELPALSWTDLESGFIDLSPWDGSTEDFEFRFTASSVSTLTRVQFNITAAHE